MTNPFTFHTSPSPFDNIDYSILDSSNLFTHDPETHCAQNLDSPNLDLPSPFEKNYDMDLETTPGNIDHYDETIYSPELIPESIPELHNDMFSRTLSEQLEFLCKQPRKTTFTITIEIDDTIYHHLNEKDKKGLEEETTSVSTKDTVIGITKNVITCQFEGTLEGIKKDWSSLLARFSQKRPQGESNYLQSITPYLMATLQENLKENQQPMPMCKVLDSLIPELLYGKEMMLSMENEFLKNLVSNELDRVRNYRPKEILDIAQCPPMKKRPEKKAPKGRKNHSNVNHMNENYVSNVFRFAKESFPEDKNLLKIASERGVSATGFRNLTTAELNDDVMVRKAKVRIVAAGEELVSNVEYWMQDGFFENCSDKEKYMQYKQKAIDNLALWRFYS